MNITLIDDMYPDMDVAPDLPLPGMNLRNDQGGFWPLLLDKHLRPRQIGAAVI